MDDNFITIGHLSTTYHTNFILMGDLYFEKEMGKKIRWKLFGTGPSMVQAFREGQLDIGYIGLPPALIGIDKGVPIKCVAGGHVEGTIMISNLKYKSVSSLNNSIEDVLAQFKGKIIGTPSRGSIHDVIINYYLEKHNLQNDIELRNYKQAELIALDMKNGIIEAGVGTPSLLTYAKTLLKSHLIIPAHFLLPNNPSYGIVFSERVIQNKPELGRIFLKYHKQASKILRESKEKAAEIICNTVNILRNNEKYVLDVLEISPKYCVALSKDYLKSTEIFIEILHKLGYIQNKLRIEDICDF
ncbi:MAG: ABC transporter substrate-binding protein, partial [Promethearchaeota archaeon]